MHGYVHVFTKDQNFPPLTPAELRPFQQLSSLSLSKSNDT
ncbi:MAG: hypothetical protein ACI9SY_000146 [Candidatus Paceibacteria bacterium]|jgi:hypothetical protein